MPDETPIDVTPVEPVSDDAELTSPPDDPIAVLDELPRAEPEPEPVRVESADLIPTNVPAPAEQSFKIVAGVNFSIGADGSITKV